MISMLVNETLIVTSSTSTTEDTSSSAHSSFRFNQKEHFLPPEHFFTFWKDFRRTKKSYLLGLSLPEITPTFTLPSGACGLTVLLEDTFFFSPTKWHIGSRRDPTHDLPVRQPSLSVSRRPAESLLNVTGTNRQKNHLEGNPVFPDGMKQVLDTGKWRIKGHSWE